MTDRYEISQLQERIEVLAGRIAAGRATWMQPELDRLRTELSRAAR